MGEKLAVVRLEKVPDGGVDLARDLLERSYISKIDTYGGKKIVYTGERTESDAAVVRAALDRACSDRTPRSSAG